MTTQAQQNTLVPSDPSQADPTILALMHGLTTSEGTLGAPDTMGDKNADGEYTAAGLGQWSNETDGTPQPLKQGEIPANFAADAKQYGLDPTDFSVANQNKVMYAVLATDKANGLSPEQALSKWNSGDPNAYQNAATSTGTGSVGAYNVSAYVQKGMTAAQKFAQSQGGKQGAGAGAPPLVPVTPPGGPVATAAPTTLGTPGASDPGLGDQMGMTGIAGDVGNFAGSLLPALPDVINDIQGKSDKSALQQLGDAGMSALWFLPFGDIAEGAAAGAEALGLGADAAKTAGVIGTGAATGYAGAVSSNLGTGESVPQAATNNVVLPTLAGGALSAATLGAGALYNKFLGQQNAVDRVQQVWEDAAGSTKSGIANMSKTADKGLTANPEFLASAGILPETSEVNGRLVFNTGADSQAQQTIDQRISSLSELRDASLDHGPTQDLGGGTTAEYNPPTVNFEDLRQQMLDQASKDYSGTAMQTAQKQINAEMDALRADPKYAINADGEMSATQTSKIKTYLQGRAGLDKLTNGLQSQVFDTMQGVAKKGVEDAAEASGNPDVKAVNKMIQQHYDAKKFLEKINGQTIKGGRLGTYVKEGVGSAVGGAIGGAIGGPIGTGVGLLAGHKGGEIVSKIMQRMAAGGPMTAATFGRMATEEPDVVQRLLQYVGKSAEDKGATAIAPIFKPAAASAADRVIGAAKASPGSRVYRGMSRPGYIFGAKS